MMRLEASNLQLSTQVQILSDTIAMTASQSSLASLDGSGGGKYFTAGGGAVPLSSSIGASGYATYNPASSSTPPLLTMAPSPTSLVAVTAHSHTRNFEGSATETLATQTF